MPVNPPIPNIGKKAVAKSIGTVNRIEPRQSEMIRAVAIITEGMEITMVVVWKNAVATVAMPVSHMWCAHTRNDKNPIVIMEKTSDLYPHSGLRELLARISATMPKAGAMST